MTASKIGLFTEQQIAQAFSPLLPGAALQVQEVLTGNINTIIKVQADNQIYGLRVRTQESVYRYEPDLIKEVFVLQLLQQEGTEPRDQEHAESFDRLRVAQSSLFSLRHDGLPVIRYCDWSRRLLPHPYCIFEWVEGESLWNTPQPELYVLTGQMLARIHQVQFSAYYADFLSIGKRPVSWRERFQAALTKEMQAAQPRLPQRVIEALGRLKIPFVTDYAPCLVHNDFAPGNILVRDGRIAAVIDWDNAVVEAPPLDFVKMKYWTARNAVEELAHEEQLFSAFVNGYGEAGQQILESPTFTLYEILWLLRVLNFEKSKEEQGLPRAPGYPAAVVYEELLSKVLCEQTGL